MYIGKWLFLMSTGCAEKGHQGKSFSREILLDIRPKLFFSFDGPLALGTSLFAKKSWSEEGENIFLLLCRISV